MLPLACPALLTFVVPLGALVNAAAVIIGSLLGLLLHRSMPERLKRIAFSAVGLCTLLIGMQMALQARSLLPVIFSMIIGGVIGEALDLHARLEALAEWLHRRVEGRQARAGASPPDPDMQDAAAPAAAAPRRFSEGLVTAFLVFCVGSMTIVGSLKEGISGDASLIYAKSLLDGLTSIALASTYGIGVLFSFLPLLLLQAALTWLGALLGSGASEQMVAQLSAVGGLLILGLGINMLELRSIRVSNLLPALAVIVLIELGLQWLRHLGLLGG